MLLDQVRNKFPLLLSKQAQKVSEAKPADSQYGQGDDAATLTVDISLRDRDFVLMHMARAKAAICVGDNAMIVCEEVLTYPRDEIEFRRRCFPGSFESRSRKGGGGGGRGWSAELRDPWMSHEYVISGLESLDKQHTYKPRNMALNCEDVIPYKFLLPQSEVEFLKQNKPGVFWRVMDDLVEMKGKDVKHDVSKDTPRTPRAKLSQTVVDHLTHTVKQVPVTVLATYANQTCDVELNAQFAAEWEQNPDRQYTIPGSVVVKEYADLSTGHAASAPVGSGDVGLRRKRRIVLKGVPISSIKPVHTLGFNVYDAACSTTDEALQVQSVSMKNDFNPRMTHDGEIFWGPQNKRRGGVAITAGPLPGDAGPACQYEWTLRLRAPSEADMYEFITLLKQSAQMNMWLQQEKMQDYSLQSARSSAAQYHTGAAFTHDSGVLEVVLVEARRLRAKMVQKHKDAKSRLAKMLEGDVNSFVVFRINADGDPIPYEQGRPIANLETIRVQADGWQGSSDGASYTIDIKDKTGGVALHWGAVFQRKQILRNAHVGGAWGPEENTGNWPHSENPNSRIEVDFTRTQSKWEITINGERMQAFDFEHRSTEPVTGIVFSESLINPKLLLIPRRELMHRGSMMQTSSVISGSDNPKWQNSTELRSTGGWVFKTPPIDPNVTPRLFIDLQLMHQGLGGITKPIGVVHLPLWGVAGVGGAPTVKLCEPNSPFNNLWLPLSTMDPKTGNLVANVSGELHIMTRWVPGGQGKSLRKLPKTARAFFLQQLRPMMQHEHVREPMFDTTLQSLCYNPNVTKEELPFRRAEVVSCHVEELYTALPYVYCCEGRQLARWTEFFDELRKWRDSGDDVEDGDQKLGQIRQEWMDDGSKEAHDHAHALDELLRRGVPARWRLSRDVRVWFQITNAGLVMEEFMSAAKPAPGTEEFFYVALVEFSKKFKSDAMLQMQEDLITAAGWESSVRPEVKDVHLQRLQRARNVCAALITLSYEFVGQAQTVELDVGDPRGEARKQMVRVLNINCAKDSTPVRYCESLLVLAFYLLLPQVGDQKVQRHGQFADPRTSKRAAKKSAPQLGREIEEECRVFWLLYTLIGSPKNHMLRDYFGVPHNDSDIPVLSDHRGVQEDVLHLSSIILTFERELWIHFGVVGFQLASVFHGVFMRLYAQTLPTASLFCLWDLLFSESTRGPSTPGNHKPQRHTLIDLGYAALCQCRAQLLQCESSLEIHDCIMDFFSSMYDPTAMIEMTTKAERELWETLPHTVGMPPQHIRDFNTSLSLYDRFFEQFRRQNDVLMRITRDIQLNSLDGRMKSGNLNNSNNKSNDPQSGSDGPDKRMTTKNVIQHVVHPLHQLFMADKGGSKGGMFRKVPQRIYEHGPVVDTGVVNTVLHHFWRAWDWAGDKVSEDTISKPHAFSLDALPRTRGEPDKLDQTEWVRQVQRGLGPDWNAVTSEIYETFASFEERHMSLSEFFMAMICCSKGTVGEKALALFGLYAVMDPPHALKHRTPVKHNAKAVVEKVEGAMTKDQGMLQPPTEETIGKETALHFKIFEHGQERPIGEAYVPNLNPYVTNEVFQEAAQQTLSIWGPVARPPPAVRREQGSADPGRVRACVGELCLGIKWLVEDHEKPHVGQLCLHVHHIEFYRDRVQNAKSKNPRIEVFTYEQTAAAAESSPAKYKSVEIPRWDPRTLGQHVGNIATAGLAYSGAYRGEIHWEETMRRDMFGALHHQYGSGGHGWDGVTNKWLWSDKWGKQYSAKDFEIRKDFCTITAKSNSISLRACRLITQAILRRSLHFVSNKQAAQISDFVFSRGGAVPGILDAVIVQGDRISDDYKTIKELRAAYDKSGKHYADVKHQMLIESEKQCDSHLGAMTLWPDVQGGQTINLKELRISDPFPMSSKVLWIRYMRAGDGERFQAQIQVNGNGEFQPSPLLLELPIDTDAKTSKAQMSVTKDEFVSCILANPLLGESLRQLSSSDSNSNRPPPWVPIKLNVTFADPSQSYEDDDLFDLMHVRRSVLMEIWDHDVGSRHEFLGECWLPPLANLGPVARKYCLPVREAGQGSKKETGKKGFANMKNLKPGQKCTGELFVQASWTMPAEPIDERDGDTLEDRVKNEENRHTGKLYLKILRAEGLRTADLKLRDVAKKGGADPYVCCYVKNDVYEDDDEKAWEHPTGSNDVNYFFRTKHNKSTINPEWNEETEVNLMTGGFEKRTTRQSTAEQHALSVVGDKDGMKVIFDDEPVQNPQQALPGSRHGVQVYLGDTISEFKQKLQLACQREAMAAQRRQESGNAGKYKALEVGFKTAVTVFVPSPELRSLAQSNRTSGHEYKQLYKVEEKDPSSWQPLDPVRTFQHYQSLYGFGMKMAQNVRVSEGTADYKIRNNRYRAFEAEQEQWSRTPEMTNSQQRCFGWAKYIHQADGGSVEWRPVLVDRPKMAGDINKNTFKVQWLYTPKLSEGTGAALARELEQGPMRMLGDDKDAMEGSEKNKKMLESGTDKDKDTEQPQGPLVAKVELNEMSVLLAPHYPKILASEHIEHQEFLAKALDLHHQGMGEPEIAEQLNTLLNAKYLSSKEDQEQERSSAKDSKVVPITTAEVRHHLDLATMQDDSSDLDDMQGLIDRIAQDGVTLRSSTTSDVPMGGTQSTVSVADVSRSNRLTRLSPPKDRATGPSDPASSGPSMSSGGPSGARPGVGMGVPSGPAPSGPSGGPSPSGPALSGPSMSSGGPFGARPGVGMGMPSGPAVAGPTGMRGGPGGGMMQAASNR